MNDDSRIIFIAAVGFLLLLVFLEWLYRNIIAKQCKRKVKVLDKGSTMGISSFGGGADYQNFYWGKFQDVETNEIIKLGMNIKLYTDIKKGQRGTLSYRKGVALSFQLMGHIKKREPSFGEKMLDFFCC